MRRILTAAVFERVLLELSPDERKRAAKAVARAARELMARHGLRRAVFLCHRALRGIGVMAAELLGASIADLQSHDPLDLTDALVCDLLFPSGSTNLVNAIADSGSPVLSVGIPVGVDPDTGEAGDRAVRAEITVAPFGYLPGVFLHDGIHHISLFLKHIYQ